jgi:hypothetical protein
MRTAALAGLSVVTLMVAGCGADQPAPRHGARPSRSVSPSPSPSPSATGPTLPPAADGSNIAACYDGDCEVRVRAPLRIPVSPSTGIATLTVTSVTAQGVTVDGVLTDGTNLEITVYADPGGLATGTVNTVQVAALGVVDGEAVLHLSHT